MLSVRYETVESGHEQQHIDMVYVAAFFIRL
jgi:hypothetical protein